jgi:hypothetical protein
LGSPPKRDGSHIQENQQIVHEIQRYYKHLFQSKPSINQDPLLDALSENSTIPNRLRLELENPITLNEIHKAIDSLAIGKSLGPDGLPAEFYKSLKSFLAPYILSMIKEATSIHRPHPTSTQGDISSYSRKEITGKSETIDPSLCYN